MRHIPCSDLIGIVLAIAAWIVVAVISVIALQAVLKYH